MSRTDPGAADRSAAGIPARNVGRSAAVVAAATLMSALLYLDRFCIGFAFPLIEHDLALSPVAGSLLVSVFFWSYALGQVPSGWLADRFGVRRMLTLYILLWSGFTALTGLAGGVAAVILARLGFGLAQAGAYPASARLIGDWVAPTQRGRASSMVALGGRIGAAAAPILTAWIILFTVPVTQDSRVAEADFGAGKAPRFCRTLVKKLALPGYHARLWNGIPPAHRQRIARIAALQADHERAIQEKQPSQPPAVADEDVAMLVREVNRALTAGVPLLDLTPPEGLSREAWALHRRAKAAAGHEAPEESAPPASGLTDAEQMRLQRLWLDASFPDGVASLYVRGWRPTMLAYGLLGVLVAAVFWIVVRNEPPERVVPPSAPAPADAATSASVPAPFPWKPIVRSFSLWMDSLTQFGTNVGWLFLVQYLPKFLAEHHRVEFVERGWLSSYPSWAGIAGMFLGGWLTDRLVRAIGLRWGRSLPIGLSRLSAAAAYFLCLVVRDPYLQTALFCVVFFSTDVGVPAVWAIKQDLGGRFVGSVLGWGNMWGNLGAAAAPFLYAACLETPLSWDAVFLLCGTSFLVAGIAGLFIDATQPIS